MGNSGAGDGRWQTKSRNDRAGGSSQKSRRGRTEEEMGKGGAGDGSRFGRDRDWKWLKKSRMGNPKGEEIQQDMGDDAVEEAEWQKRRWERAEQEMGVEMA